MADYDPRVAFGLKAMTLALKAKDGRATPAMAAALLFDCDDMVRGDPDARKAAQDFACDMDDDMTAAGEALLAFCLRWPNRSLAPVAAQTARVLAEAKAGFYDWQLRKDCGHD